LYILILSFLTADEERLPTENPTPDVQHLPIVTPSPKI
jgi:hypothetical protein